MNVPHFLYIWSGDLQASQVEAGIEHSLSKLKIASKVVATVIGGPRPYAYAWVSSMAGWNVLIGKNADGSPRGTIRKEVEPKETKAFDADVDRLDAWFDANKRRMGSWAEYEDRLDLLKAKHGFGFTMVDAPPLVSFDNMKVNPMGARQSGCNLRMDLFKAPKWLTQELIHEEFEPFMQKGDQLRVTMKKDHAIINLPATSKLAVGLSQLKRFVEFSGPEENMFFSACVQLV